MPELRQLRIPLLFVLLSIAISLGVWAFGHLPDEVPLALWQGEPVSWGSKWNLLLRGPAVMLVLLAAIAVGLKWDRTLVGRRRMGALGPVLVLMFCTTTYGHARMLLFAASGATSMVYGIGDIVVGGLMYMGVGNYLAKTESNGFWAFQYPWLKGNEGAYLKTQRMAAWLFVGVGAAYVLASPLVVTLPLSVTTWATPVTVLAIVLIVTLASWIFARGEAPALGNQT